MKTIAVVLPINNPDILTQADLTPYNNDKVKFVLHYVDTDLKEINTAEEGAQVLKLVIKKSKQQAKAGAAAIIVYAFGELGIAELKESLNIPVMALGTEAVKQASELARENFTIISGCLIHNDFWQPLIDGTQTADNYVKSSTAPETTPAQIRNDKKIIEKILLVAENEIANHNVDSFTLGCGSFIGAAAPLQKEIRARYGNAFTVIDPIEATFNKIKDFIN